MPTTINKICVDSRFRSFDSPSTSNFKIELKENILIPENYGAVITDICIPRSWYTVEYNNNKLYFAFQSQALFAELYVVRQLIITIPSRNYDINSLASTLKTTINTQVVLARPNDFSSITPFNVLADVSTGTISIIPTNGLELRYSHVYTDIDMQNMPASIWSGPSYVKDNLQSINSVLSNVGEVSAPLYQKYSAMQPYVSGFINTLPYDSIFITCNQLSAFENIGPRGERNLLKKVLVNEPYGGLLNDNWINEYDFTNVGRLLLRTLEFKVQDPYGNELNLHGATVSFSVLLIDISSKIF